MGPKGRRPNIFRGLSVLKGHLEEGGKDASITNTYRASYVPKHHPKYFTCINLLKPVVYRVLLLFLALGSNDLL